MKLLMTLAAFVLISTSVTTGCATVLKGTTQRIPIASDPSGAEIVLDGQHVGSTPMDVAMKRKRDHLVTIRKDGYHEASAAVVKDVGGAVWGNIILGGLVGWGVDAASGAQYNLTPQTVHLVLLPDAVTKEKENDDQAAFVARLNLLDDLRERALISDAEYSSGKLKLFQQYMPTALVQP